METVVLLVTQTHTLPGDDDGEYRCCGFLLFLSVLYIGFITLLTTLRSSSYGELKIGLMWVF